MKRAYGNGDHRVAAGPCPLGVKCTLMARERPAKIDSNDADVVKIRYSRCSGKVRTNEEWTT